LALDLAAEQKEGSIDGAVRAIKRIVATLLGRLPEVLEIMRPACEFMRFTTRAVLPEISRNPD
jgi:hypothetical protein